MKIAHVVNLFAAPQGSAAWLAQQVTLASMRQARAATAVDVTQWAITTPADAALIPPDFATLPPLTRSVLDVATFRVPRPLPLLRDILDGLYAASAADYFVYTNADIGLQPDFYTAVARLVADGYDSFVINRRTISDDYDSPAQLAEILAEAGKPHPGWDCFVFPRACYPRFKLGDVCLGAGRMGLALLANLVAYSNHFREFTELHLTFHLGDDRSWRNAALDDYAAHNTRAVMAALAAIEAEVGPFGRSTIPGRFLWRKRTFGALYDWWSRR